MSAHEGYDWFHVDTTTHTWPTGNGGRASGSSGSPPAGALTPAGKLIILHSIITLGPGTPDGALEILDGTGATIYWNPLVLTTATDQRVFNARLINGLSARKNAGVGVGGYVIVFKLLR